MFYSLFEIEEKRWDVRDRLLAAATTRTVRTGTVKLLHEGSEGFIRVSRGGAFIKKKKKDL